MRTDLEIGQRREFELDHALLVYQEPSGPEYTRRAFVTRHEVKEVNGVPALGPGMLLDVNGVKSLVRLVAEQRGVQFLPENVIAASFDILAWWTPARKRAMFFGNDTMYNIKGPKWAAEFSGKVYPQPPLLWMVRFGQLHMRALGADRRPRVSDKVCMAPYWNTYENGSVCLGNMVRPQITDVTTLEKWEQGFHDSMFTHPAGQAVYTTMKGGFPALWQSLVGKDEFPMQHLRPLKQTVEQFVKQAKDDE